MYYPSVGTIISEEDAYCIPERPSVYKIRHCIQGGKPFDRWPWQFNLDRQGDGEGGYIISVVYLRVTE